MDGCGGTRLGRGSGWLGGALLLMPLPCRLRLLGVPLLLPRLAPPLYRTPPGEFEVVAADVGQGTAVLLRTRSHLLVYDTGPRAIRSRSTRRSACCCRCCAPAAKAGSPADADTHALRIAGVPHWRCLAGQSWHWNGVRFGVLHPLPGDYVPAAKSNTLSCVLRAACCVLRAAFCV